MGFEEFIWQIERSERLEKLYEDKYKYFSQVLTRNLLSVVIKYQPKAKRLQREVLNVATDYISEVWDVFDIIYSNQSEGIRCSELMMVRKPQTREEAQKDLDRHLEELKVDNVIFSAIFWDGYREDYLRQEYSYAIYMVMKKSFTACYFDDIMKWDGDGLRFFDRAVSWHCAEPFEQDIYGVLKGEVREYTL